MFKEDLGSTTGTGRMKLGRMGRRGEEAIDRIGSRTLAGTGSSSGEDSALVAAASKGRRQEKSGTTTPAVGTPPADRSPASTARRCWMQEERALSGLSGVGK